MNAKGKDFENLEALVVDDNEFLRNVVSATLDSIGFSKIGTASDGRQALSMLESGTPDLVLCDLNMPEMDGIEFLRHLSNTGFIGGVVLISGEDRRILDSAQELAKSHNLNILGAIEKPVTPDILGEVIKGLSQPHSTPAAFSDNSLTAAEIEKGLAGNNLNVYFQPKVDVKSKKMVGAESLARWINDVGNVVGPNQFIPVAEEFGLIDPLTDAVFVKSIEILGEWLEKDSTFKTSVNISVDSLNRLNFPQFIEDVSKDHNVDAKNIVLEVTESRLMKDLTSALEILSRLRLKGIALSIDDFGTGYSSMEQLQRIPFTELKIDRAFVNGAVNDSSARAILESSIDLAKKLNLETVAEGVENQEDWDLVAELGVDMVQGYFVAKPMAAKELWSWYESYKATQNVPN